MAILPVYLSRQGADVTFTGIYFACLWLSLAVSAVLAGLLADRLQHWKRLAVAGAMVMMLAQMGQVFVTALIPFCALSLLIAFAVSVHLTMVSVLAGLQAGAHERGRVFGVLAVASSLGGILTGLSYGKIADRFGFTGLWWFVSALFALSLAAALFYREPRAERSAERSMETSSAGPRKFAPRESAPRLGGKFYLLMAASVVCWVMINGARLGISVSMDRYQFSAADISLNGAIVGIIALPSGLALGWLSDHLGRKRLMIAVNALGAGALLILSFNHTLLAFWSASLLLSFNGAFSTLTSAVATDLAPRRALGLALSLASTAISVGGVIGSAALGYAFQGLGIRATFLIALVFPLTVAALMLPLPETVRKHQTEVRAAPGEGL